MSDKKKVNLMIDPKLWDELGAIAKEVGMKKSPFVEMILKASVQGQKMPIGDVLEDALKVVAKSKK